jgi:hypothetical protein
VGKQDGGGEDPIKRAPPWKTRVMDKECYVSRLVLFYEVSKFAIEFTTDRISTGSLWILSVRVEIDRLVMSGKT